MNALTTLTAGELLKTNITNEIGIPALTVVIVQKHALNIVFVQLAGC